MNKTQRNPVVVQFFHPDPPYANKKEPNVKEWKVGPQTRNLICMDNCKYVQKDGKLSGASSRSGGNGRRMVKSKFESKTVRFLVEFFSPT